MNVVIGCIGGLYLLIGMIITAIVIGYAQRKIEEIGSDMLGDIVKSRKAKAQTIKHVVALTLFWVVIIPYRIARGNDDDLETTIAKARAKQQEGEA